MTKRTSQHPAAITATLLPTDSILVWQTSATPHTSHATMSQVLGAMAALPATFASIKVGGVAIGPGPTLAQFSALDKSAVAANTGLVAMQDRIATLQVRLAALEAGAPPTVTVNHVADQKAGSSFIVSGTVSGVTTIPTLQYQANTGPWTAMPVSLKIAEV